MKIFDPLITHQLTLYLAIKIISARKSDEVFSANEFYKLKSHLGIRTHWRRKIRYIVPTYIRLGLYPS